MSVSPAIIWLVIAVAFAIVEITTMGLVSIWFAIGAVAAMIVALAGGGTIAQLVVFIIVSGIVLAIARPLAAKYVNSRAVKTNIDALIGRKLVAKTDIDNVKGTGKVDMDGTTWLAQSSNDNIVIEKGEEVTVVKVTGAKLIVEKVM